ncbi:MAG: DUF1456 family protein [Chitinophagales bacterium]
MNNNDIIRQLRYTFNLSDKKVVELFALEDKEVSEEQVVNWLKKEDDPNCVVISDYELATFLNGFISDKRGKKEGATPQAEKELNNNIILRKLKIALELKDTDLLEILAKADMQISKHELSAFFRKPTQGQYMPCKDQIMRRFLHGLQLKYH